MSAANDRAGILRILLEVNRMRKGYVHYTLTSVDILKLVETGEKVIEIYEGVIHRENFKISPFRKIMENVYTLKQKYKDKNNE